MILISTFWSHLTLKKIQKIGECDNEENIEENEEATKIDSESDNELLPLLLIAQAKQYSELLHYFLMCNSDQKNIEEIVDSMAVVKKKVSRMTESVGQKQKTMQDFFAKKEKSLK